MKYIYKDMEKNFLSVDVGQEFQHVATEERVVLPMGYMLHVVF